MANTKGNVRYPELLAEMGRNGESKTDIAKLLGLSKPTISSRFLGRSEWRNSEIETLCVHYNRDYFELFKKKEG